MTATAFSLIVWLWIGLAIIVFLVNIRIIAPYGRHASRNWGPLMNSRLAWIIMESPVIIIVAYFMLSASSNNNAVVWVLAGLFMVHYLHRILIFPFRIKRTIKRMPLGVVILAILFNFCNGYFIGFYLAYLSGYENSWFASVPFISGLVLFSVGAYINIKSDSILFSLRKDGSTGYRIPQGFLYSKISCPNHLGEIIEWLGYAIMSYNIAALAFVVWTAANLIPRSLAHHKWYNAYFKEYPKSRKAVIPGIL